MQVLELTSRSRPCGTWPIAPRAALRSTTMARPRAHSIPRRHPPPTAHGGGHPAQFISDHGMSEDDARRSCCSGWHCTTLRMSVHRDRHEFLRCRLRSTGCGRHCAWSMGAAVDSDRLGGGARDSGAQRQRALSRSRRDRQGGDALDMTKVARARRSRRARSTFTRSRRRPSRQCA